MKKVILPLLGLGVVILGVLLSGVLDGPSPTDVGGGPSSSEGEETRVIPDFGGPAGAPPSELASSPQENASSSATLEEREEADRGELSGRVIDHAGEAIEGVTIHLVKNSERTAGEQGVFFGGLGGAPPLDSSENRRQTDVDGRFRYDTLEQGQNYSLYARGDSWVGQRKYNVKAGDPEIVLTLDLGDSVSGTVIDPRGRRVEGAKVRSGPSVSKLGDGMYFPNFTDGNDNAIHPEVLTREDGTFVLSGIPLGEFSIVASHETWGPSEAVNLMQGQENLRIELRSSTGIAGRVVDDRGDPIAGAKVTAMSLFGFSPGAGSLGEGITGPQGEFQVEGLPPGRIRVLASASGFTGTLMGRGVQLTEGELTDLELTLTAAAKIRGSVVDETGAPVADATVRFGMHSDDRSHFSMNGFAGLEGEAFSDATTKTDAAGAFVLETVRPDSSEPRRVLQVDHPKYLPFAGDLIAVSAGQEIEVEPISLTGALTISGRITGADGVGIAGARVTLREGAPGDEPSASHESMDLMVLGEGLAAPSVLRGGRASSSGVTDEAGNYLLRVDEPGTVHISVRAANFQEGESDAVAVSEASVSDWNLQLLDALQISGIVTDELGVPCVGVELSAAPPEGGRSREATSDAEGQFTIDGLDAGLVMVEASGAGWRLAEPLDEVAAGTTGLQVVVLRPGEVTGRITHAQTGDPVTRFSIQISEVHDGDDSSRFFNGSFSLSSIGGVEYRDPDGRFLLEKLVPGKHRITVKADQMVSSSVEVEVASGRSSEVELELEPAGSIVGRLLDTSGEPISGVRVNAVELDEDGKERPTRRDRYGMASVSLSVDDGTGAFITMGGGDAPAQTDDEGFFRVDGLETGNFKVKFETSRYRPFEIPEVAVTLGAVTDLGTNTLEKGATIRGQVTLPGGRSLMWCSLRFEMLDPPEDARTKTKRISPGEGGEFELGGLDAGTYEVTARYVPMPDDPETMRFDGSSQRHTIGTITLGIDDDQTMNPQLPMPTE